MHVTSCSARPCTQQGIALTLTQVFLGHVSNVMHTEMHCDALSSKQSGLPCLVQARQLGAATLINTHACSLALRQAVLSPDQNPIVRLACRRLNKCGLVQDVQQALRRRWNVRILELLQVPARCMQRCDEVAAQHVSLIDCMMSVRACSETLGASSVLKLAPAADTLVILHAHMRSW